GRHQPDRSRREKPLILVNALALEQTSEGQIVVRGRKQPSRTGRKYRRLGPHARAGERLLLHPPSLEIRHVVGREPAASLRRYREAGVLHTQRLEDAG